MVQRSVQQRERFFLPSLWRPEELLCAGFEFAGGIPGTLGGAVVMNAGAYGGEMKDVLKEVTVMTGDGEIRVIPASELEMGYRTSIIKNSRLSCARRNDLT